MWMLEMTPPPPNPPPSTELTRGSCLGVKIDHEGDRQERRKKKFQNLAGKGDRARTAQRQVAIYVNYGQNRIPVELGKIS